jgi:hypothetical protein
LTFLPTLSGEVQQDDSTNLMQKSKRIDIMLGKEQQIILKQKMLDIENRYVRETEEAKKLLCYLKEQRMCSTLSLGKQEGD